MRKTVVLNPSPDALMPSSTAARNTVNLNIPPINNSVRLSAMRANDSPVRGQSTFINLKRINSDPKLPFSIDEVLRQQSKILQQFRKNEAKYVDALNKINSQIEQLKQQTAFVKVENGRTVAEYLTFRNHHDVEDRKKRFDCLALLDNYARSARNSNSVRVLPVVKHYYAPQYQPVNIKPTRKVSFKKSEFQS